MENWRKIKDGGGGEKSEVRRSEVQSTRDKVGEEEGQLAKGG